MTWLLGKCLLVQASPNSDIPFTNDVEFHISYHLQYVSLISSNAFWSVWRAVRNTFMSHGLRNIELNPADTGRPQFVFVMVAIVHYHD